MASRSLAGRLSGLSLVVLTLTGLEAVGADRERKDADPTERKPLVFRLVCPDGKPLQGARLGSGRGQWDDPDHWRRGWRGTLVRWSFGGLRCMPALSGSDGKVAVPYERVFRRGEHESFYAWHPATGLVGTARVSAEAPGRDVRITLQPACRVFGVVDSDELRQRNRELLNSEVYLLWQSRSTFLSHHSSEGRFEFLLPPGEYRLRLGGWGKGLDVPGSGGIPLIEQQRSFRVEPGQRSVDLGRTDLRVTEIGKLVGRPAPELKGIVGWKNTRPIKLADLKGKVVLLVFWSFSCGPCIGSMPWYSGIHDRYAEKGLVVLGIHDAKAGSIEEMDRKVASAREKRWGGRDIPFPVALDGDKRQGNTCGAYRISWLPTLVLIDRDGKVAHICRGGSSWYLIDKALGIASPR